MVRNQRLVIGNWTPTIGDRRPETRTLLRSEPAKTATLKSKLRETTRPKVEIKEATKIKTVGEDWRTKIGETIEKQPKNGVATMIRVVKITCIKEVATSIKVETNA